MLFFFDVLGDSSSKEKDGGSSKVDAHMELFAQAAGRKKDGSGEASSIAIQHGGGASSSSAMPVSASASSSLPKSPSPAVPFSAPASFVSISSASASTAARPKPKAKSKFAPAKKIATDDNGPASASADVPSGCKQCGWDAKTGRKGKAPKDGHTCGKPNPEPKITKKNYGKAEPNKDWVKPVAGVQQWFSKVSGVSFGRVKAAFSADYCPKDGKKVTEFFYFKHYERPTNEEQIRAAWEDAVRRRQEALDSGEAVVQKIAPHHSPVTGVTFLKDRQRWIAVQNVNADISGKRDKNWLIEHFHVKDYCDSVELARKAARSTCET